MDKCEHMNFRADVKVGRLTRSETDATVVAYNADIEIICADCKKQFEFVGLPMGFSHNEPRCSINALQARIPIKPQGEEMAIDLPSFSVRQVV